MSLILCTNAWGEPQLLAPGDPVPEAGVFYSGESLEKLVEALRDRETWKAQIEAFREQVQALEEALVAARGETADLKAALEAQKLALAKAEVLEKNWDKIMGRYEDLLQKMDAYAALLEQRVAGLERQRNLALLANPVVMIFTLLLGAFLW